ncbi:hypothetical protein B0T16DRAFT_437466 [Cercophora newfieldiana]|uniref:Uncharacterized protein n=1 Tax=Cercophora newfieldiana TaxID=92897 RepID=A0AA39Y5Y9_9PEZI|nr:hypothetical protein B0T16DRAFT_437466 [Cercophora newfieldiana]
MSVTSPLTSIESVSSPGSYQTARGSTGYDPDVTGISSPVPDDSFKGPRFRSAVQPVHQLRAHVQIQLEEGQHRSAITLLDNLLTDGTAPKQSLNPTPPARVPPPAQLAFLNTLTIHPSYTSRAPNSTNLHAAARSLAFLRAVLQLTGPVNANLRAAFTFRSGGRHNRGGRRGNTYGSSPAGSSTSSLDSEVWEGPLANEQSIWQRGTDFWSTLGWAFRCASAHPERWRHWQVWLEYMVEVLEKDWDERKQLDKEQSGVAESQGSQGAEWNMLKESLLVAYLDDFLQWERRDKLKDVMRALMAFTDEGASEDKVYREVFERELAAAPGKSKRKRAATAAGEAEPEPFLSLADYAMEDDLGIDEDDDGEGSCPDSPSAGKSTTTRPSRGRGRPRLSSISPKAQPNRAVSDSMAETVALRLRIFRLLSAAAYYIPERSFQVEDLYEQFSNRVYTLPLPMFRLFIESMPTALLPEHAFVRVTLLRNLADRLLPGKRPDPLDVDPAGELSPALLEQCLLPFAAGRVTSEENAKLSLVLESMVWFLFENTPSPIAGQAGATEDERAEALKAAREWAARLAAAVETGIKAREDKIRKRNTGLTAADREARETLARSTRNLRVFVQVLEGEVGVSEEGLEEGG